MAVPLPAGLCLAATLACPIGAQDRWQPISTEAAPSRRLENTTVWTGREIVVFGGRTPDDRDLGDGAAYDPALDAWRPLATERAPSPRAWHTAVWTGTEMIVWGGHCEGDGECGDGAAYDPSEDRWRTISSDGAPTARGSHVAVWTGKLMIVWAGVSEHASFPAGATYDPKADRWEPMTILFDDVMTPRTLPAIFTGREMIAWGGINGGYVLGDGFAWNVESRTPRLLPASGAPSPRAHHAVVFTGSELVVWGGSSSIYGGSPFDDGARFDVSSRSWRPLEVERDTPSERFSHAFTWTGAELWILGGAWHRDRPPLDDAFAWHPEKGWRTLPKLPGRRAQAHAIATDRGVFLIGGRDGAGPVRGGFVITP